MQSAVGFDITVLLGEVSLELLECLNLENGQTAAVLVRENGQSAAVVVLQEPVSEEAVVGRKEMKQQSHQCWRKLKQEILEEVVLIAE
jgi:hypothetical protein